MNNTPIEWTDVTWNPVTGCSKVSPGCAHCYAEGVAARFWPTQYPPVEYESYSVDACCPITEMRTREFTDVLCHEDRLDQPLRWKKPRKVFVNSMSDLFHEDVPDAFIDRVFAVMALAPQHTFQILTKRPDRMRAYLTEEGRERRFAIEDEVFPIAGENDALTIRDQDWPLKNVWLGVSVENQHFADERIPLLLQTPAAVRFISAEPLLGPVDLGPWITGRHVCDALNRYSVLEWVIVGGESGAGARPFDLAWARSIVAQCKAAGVACFVKQLGAKPVVLGDPAHEDPRWRGTLRVDLSNRKGGDLSEWPADLRVRQFPEASA